MSRVSRTDYLFRCYRSSNFNIYISVKKNQKEERKRKKQKEKGRDERKYNYESLIMVQLTFKTPFIYRTKRGNCYDNKTI